MRYPRFSRGTGAFTLIEMVCVLAIIGILAALLLPVLSQGRARVQRIACVNHLHQIGQAFHVFAHDHNGRFPMQVSASAGGSSEFVESAYRVEGPFYFAYRHFQVLSNDLVTPKTVLCPADTRLAARSFAELKNDNLSYFVGAKAEVGQATSILAGDRNLARAKTSSIARLGPGQALRWTGELHRFKGNVLLGDGHVEERNSPGIRVSQAQAAVTTEFFLPSVDARGGLSVSASVENHGTGGGSGGGNRPEDGENAGGSGKVVAAADWRPSQGRPGNDSAWESVERQRERIAKPGTVVDAETLVPTARSNAPLSAATNTPAEVRVESPAESDYAAWGPVIGWITGHKAGLVRSGVWAVVLLLLGVGVVAWRRMVRARTRPGPSLER